MKAAILIGQIEKETEKAIMIEVLNGPIWLPKSQVEIVESSIGLFIVLEWWLFRRNHRNLSWNSRGRKMYDVIDGNRPSLEIEALINS